MLPAGPRREGLPVLRPPAGDLVAHGPRLEAAPIPDHLDLDPVLLHVGAGDEEEDAAGHRADLVALPPVVQPPPVGRLVLFGKRQSQHEVHERAEQARVALRLLVLLRDPGPTRAPDERVRLPDAEADRVAVAVVADRLPPSAQAMIAWAARRSTSTPSRPDRRLPMARFRLCGICPRHATHSYVASCGRPSGHRSCSKTSGCRC